MHRALLILVGLTLVTGPLAAQNPSSGGVSAETRTFTLVQERAAAEARARQARIRTRQAAHVSLARPTFRGWRPLLDDPRVYRIDPGIAPQTIHVPWLK